jgi:hypothetical protein
MPWTAKQVHTFRALEHGWKPSKGSLGDLASLGAKKLGEMADEGVKKGKKRK